MSNPTVSQPQVSHPWDMAGADGLVAARALFGESVDYLAPFQSMETALAGEPCSVLRLGDRNFRITYPGPLDALVADLHLNIWIKQLDWLDALVLLNQFSTIAPSNTSLPLVAAEATVRAPHRLRSLPLHRAVPAQLWGMAVLIWHHPLAGQPALELHVAQTQISELRQLIQSSKLGSVAFTTACT